MPPKKSKRHAEEDEEGSVGEPAGTPTKTPQDPAKVAAAHKQLIDTMLADREKSQAELINQIRTKVECTICRDRWLSELLGTGPPAEAPGEAQEMDEGETPRGPGKKKERDYLGARSFYDMYTSTVMRGRPEDCSFHLHEKIARDTIKAIEKAAAERLPTFAEQRLEAFNTRAQQCKWSHEVPRETEERALELCVDMPIPFRHVALDTVSALARDKLRKPRAYIHASKPRYLAKEMMPKYEALLGDRPDKEPFLEAIKAVREEMVYVSNVEQPATGGPYIDTLALAPIMKVKGEILGVAVSPPNSAGDVTVFVVSTPEQATFRLYRLYDPLAHPDYKPLQSGAAYDWVPLPVSKAAADSCRAATNKIWSVTVVPLTDTTVFVSFGALEVSRFTVDFDRDYERPAVVIDHKEHVYLSSEGKHMNPMAGHMVISPIPNPRLVGPHGSTANLLYVLFKDEPAPLVNPRAPTSSKPDEGAAEAPSQTPSDAPEGPPAEAPMDTGTAEPMETSAAPGKDPTEDSGKGPTQDASKAPTEGPAQAPAEEPTNAPTQEPAKKPPVDSEIWACAIYEHTDLYLATPVMKAQLCTPTHVQLGVRDPLMFHSAHAFFSPSLAPAHGWCMALIADGDGKESMGAVLIHQALPQPEFDETSFITLLQVPSVRDVCCIGDRLYYINDAGCMGYCPMNEFTREAQEARKYTRGALVNNGYFRLPASECAYRLNTTVGTIMQPWLGSLFIKPASSEFVMVVARKWIDEAMTYEEKDDPGLPDLAQISLAKEAEDYETTAKYTVLEQMKQLINAQTDLQLSLPTVVVEFAKLFAEKGLRAPTVVALKKIVAFIGRLWHELYFITLSPDLIKALEKAKKPLPKERKPGPNDPPLSVDAAEFAWILVRRMMQVARELERVPLVDMCKGARKDGSVYPPEYLEEVEKWIDAEALSVSFLTVV
jgi:hypothetical protein